jgi:DNA repair exonuclease SbcCD ATPase subunit
MRKPIIFIASLIVIAGFILAGCDSSSEKISDAHENVKDAKDNVADAEYDLYIAKQDSSEEYLKFKRESEDRINELDNQIAELKLKISKEKKNEQNESMELLNDLERRTAQMKKELKEYVATKDKDWIMFRDKYKKNMDDLGKSISNFFTNTE